MWHDFSGHPDSMALCSGNQISANTGRYVANVKPTLCDCGKREVARDDNLFSGGGNGPHTKSPRCHSLMHCAAGQARIFAVDHYWQVERAGCLERDAHDPRVPRRLPVVGKSERTVSSQPIEIDRPTAAALFTNCGNWAHSNHRIALRTTPQLLEGNHGVERGNRVRHAKHCREPAGGRCGSPGPNGFLPFLTWFAQVDMDINQPRRHDQPSNIDNS